LEPAEYGELALGLTVAGLVNQVATGGVIAGVGRFYAVAVERDDFRGYLRATVKLGGYAALVVGMLAAAIVLSLVWLGLLSWALIVAAAFVLSLVASINSGISSIQSAARQRSLVALHTGLDAWLKIGLAVAAMLCFGKASAVVIAGYALSALLITASQMFFFRRLIVARAPVDAAVTHQDWSGAIWRYSWPFSAWGLFTWAHQASDRWALQSFGSTKDVGSYAVLFQLSYVPITVATGLMLTFLAPILYQRSGDATQVARNDASHNLVWAGARFALLLTIIAFVVGLLAHDLIFSVLVSAAYRTTSQWLPWMILAGGLFATGQILTLKLMTDMRTSRAIPLKIGTAIVGTALSVIGAASHGLPGVVAATVIFAIIYLAWAALVCRRS
jgi:O-antigen/teichoic acid export membrane protein